MYVSVVVLPSFWSSGYAINFNPFDVGEITQERRYLFLTLVLPSLNRNFVDVIWFVLVSCRGDSQGSRIKLYSRSPLSEPVVADFTVGALFNSCRGDSHGGDIFNTLVLPLWTEIYVFLTAFWNTTFLCILCWPNFRCTFASHQIPQWWGVNHDPLYCIYIV